jgi:hypothetical protein
VSNIHINWTRYTYVPRVRPPGYRKYTLLKETKSIKNAMRQLADHMATGKYKRGDILGCQEWYDPNILYEVVKR